MKKTDQKILKEIIRVDHAGERGAIKIYEGQLLALNTIKQDENLKSIIEDRENVITVAPTQGIFSWTGGDDEGQRKRGPGANTKKEVSKWIFENPKAYKIGIKFIFN